MLEELLSLSNQTAHLNVMGLRVARMIRLLRILRLLRAIRCLHELRVLVMGIYGSMVQLFWCIGFLLMIMFITAAAIIELLLEERADPASTFIPFIEERFDGLPGAVYTLFIIISGGADWSDIAQPLFDIDPPIGYLFLLYVTFVVLCALNVFTGLFVERARQCMQRDKDHMSIEDQAARNGLIQGMTELFAEVDANYDGTITCEEFETCAQSIGVQAYLRTVGLNLDVVQPSAVFALLDVDGVGAITLCDFVDGLSRICGLARQHEVMKLERRMCIIMQHMGIEPKCLPSKIQRSSCEMFDEPNEYARNVSLASSRNRLANGSVHTRQGTGYGSIGPAGHVMSIAPQPCKPGPHVVAAVGASGGIGTGVAPAAGAPIDMVTHLPSFKAEADVHSGGGVRPTQASESL
eukprot:NODE_6342_length_1680_cov_9.756600.p1 GENE.NODE_6342_length_1680_cov_9.756600~~NODE_6342_length_1680_cov_9.756600.p1  ORF type:complete len:408 (+),score=111.64 NODE_6342_length_1680_cov_9.756600:80-1303(+)